MKRGFLSVFGTATMLLGVSIYVSSEAPADDSLNVLQKHVEILRSQQQGGAKAETQRIFDRARAEAQAVGAKLQQTRPKQPISLESDIQRTHVRATGGVPFPKPEEVVLEPQPTIVIPASEGMSENIQERPYKKPPRCESPEVKRDEWPLDDNKEERIVGDILYIAEELMPVDSMEVFGSKVEVYPYGPKSGDGVHIRMTLDAVPCVPYRIRVTNRARYYHKGNLALKNYDKQLGGGGQYHSWIQQKLFFGK